MLGTENTLIYDLRKVLRNKFLQLFGIPKAMKPEMKLTYKARTHGVGSDKLRKLKMKYLGTVMYTIKYEEKV